MVIKSEFIGMKVEPGFKRAVRDAATATGQGITGYIEAVVKAHLQASTRCPICDAATERREDWPGCRFCPACDRPVIFEGVEHD